MNNWKKLPAGSMTGVLLSASDESVEAYLQQDDQLRAMQPVKHLAFARIRRPFRQTVLVALVLLVSRVALAATPNLCQPAARNAAGTCPGIYDVGAAAGTCSTCAQGIPTLADGGLATVPVFIACGKCSAFLGKLDPCAIALSKWAECDTPCVGKPNGTNLCGGPMIDGGLDFFQCQQGYPSLSGACRPGQSCDPKKAFVWGSVDPPQCGDCDNDHGQAPLSSYHNGEGYCMPESGDAPGWHECVSKTGGPGGHWLFLPQLNNQRNCHPHPPGHVS